MPICPCLYRRNMHEMRPKWPRSRMRRRRRWAAGKSYGCVSDVCAPTDTGCATVCLPVAGDQAACTGPADCTAGFCTGDHRRSSLPQGACLEAKADQLTSMGGTCFASKECASNVCVANQCTSPCSSSAGCTSGSLCHLYVPPEPLTGLAGTCQPSLNALPGTTCTTDADCDFAYCDGHMGPNGLERYCALTVGSKTVGEACSSNNECQYANCLFNEDIGFEPAYCSRICNDDSECAVDMSCRPVTVYDNQTPDLADDLVVSRCVKGGANQSCSLIGAGICNEGLTCQDVGLLQGVCR